LPGRLQPVAQGTQAVFQPLEVPAERVGQIIAGQHATMRKQRRLELDHVPIPVLPGLGELATSRGIAGGSARWADEQLAGVHVEQPGEALEACQGELPVGGLPSRLEGSEGLSGDAGLVGDRAHALVCLLACYLAWQLRRALAPLCFTDQAPPTRTDPVAPAQRSTAATAKAARRRLPDGSPAHSFRTLLDHLGTLTRDQIEFADPAGARIHKLTSPTPTQRRAFELLGAPIPLALT
jgi:hypothetical protein